MKILHVSPVLHSCFSDLMIEQKEDNEIVFVKINFEGEQKIERVGDPLNTINLSGVIKIFDQKYDKSLKESFEKIISCENPDIVHIHSFTGLSILPLLDITKKYSAKSVLSLHDHSLFCVKGIYYDKKNCNIDSLYDCNCSSCLDNAEINKKEIKEYNHIREEIVKEIIAKSDKILCPSNFQKNELIRLFDNEDNIEKVYYGLDLEKSSKIKREGDVVFGYLGSPSWMKGIKTLEIIREVDNFKLIVGFSYSKGGEFDDKVEELKKHENIKVKENIKRDKLYEEFFSKIDYLIVPSIWNETGPLTLFESLHYGVPVIIRDLDSLKEKIKKTKYSIVFKDENELKEIIKKIISEKNRHKENINIRNTKDYIKDVMKIYEDVLKNTLVLDLGGKCNNNCKICVRRDKNPLNLDEIDDILKKNKGSSVIFEGGEPTIRKDFFKIIDMADSLGYDITIKTNARILSYDDFARRLGKYKVKIQTFVNSYDPKIHDKTTNTPDSFFQTMKGIENMKKEGSIIRVEIRATEENSKDIHKTNKFLKDKGIKNISTIYDYKKIPDEIKIELTNKCNFECSFCFNDKNNKFELDKKHIKKIVSEAKKEGVKAIRFTGGEPFMRSDLAEILKISQDADMYTILNTNGELIDDNSAPALKNVDDLLISFHDIERKEKIKEIVAKVKNINPNIYIRACTIGVKKNIEKLEEFYKSFIDIGYDEWFILRPVPTKNNIPLEIKDMKDLIKKILDMNKKYKIDIRITNSVPYCMDENARKVCVGGINDSGQSRLVVDSSGKIKTDYFSDKILGNISNDNIMDIWNSRRMQDIRNLHHVNKICDGCPDLLICKGGLSQVKEEYMILPR